MDIQQHQHGAVAVLKPQGPLTGDDAEAVRQRLLEAISQQHGRVVLDASAIPLVDSKGLEALVDVNDSISVTGQALRICGANTVVRRVLELTDLAALFEHFEDANAAVRSFL